MAENLAQEIRNQEAGAKQTVADAKSKAGEMVAAAQAEATQMVKTTKQQCHRQWLASVADAEKEAEEQAKGLLLKGEDEAKSFYEDNEKSVGETADWLVKEVTSSYGSC